MGDWNLQDWKMTDHQKTGGVEFAGLENDGVEQEQTYILHTMKNFNVHNTVRHVIVSCTNLDIYRI